MTVFETEVLPFEGSLSQCSQTNFPTLELSVISHGGLSCHRSFQSSGYASSAKLSPVRYRDSVLITKDIHGNWTGDTV